MIDKRGFSLIEAMISMVIVGVTLAAGAWLFFANQKTTAIEMTRSFVRANSRQALSVIGNDVIQAGVLCRASKIKFNGNNKFLRPIEGGNTHFQGFFDGRRVGRYINYNSHHTDAIEIVVPDPVNSAYATVDLHSGNTSLSGIKIDAEPSPISSSYIPRKRDLYLITNANYIDNPMDPTSGAVSNAFKLLSAASFVSGHHNHGIYDFPSITPHLHDDFSSGAGLLKINIHRYYVSWSHVSATKLPELRCVVYNGHGNKNFVVAEGIEDMQIEYGIDNDGDDSPDTWIKNLNTIRSSDSNYFKLRAVKITISAISKPLPVSYLGKKTGNNDINYYRPAISDHAKHPNISPNIPVYRDVSSEVFYLRNFMSNNFYGN